MAEKKIIISPKTKIGELLDAYPQLEQVLIAMSPVFEKLRNPVLRRTVARVATIQQVSVVGGIPVEDIVKRLRTEAGQSVETGNDEIHEHVTSIPPAWFDETKIAFVYDATPVINAGESPMSEVLRKSGSLKAGEIFELRTPFVPAPILDILKEKKFLIWSVQKEGAVINYIIKS